LARTILLNGMDIETFGIASLEALGGGRIGLCRLPGRSGDLAGDVAVIQRWTPALVVSLTESAEMERLGGGGLAVQLAKAGIDWRHFPVADFSVPEAASGAGWVALAAELHRVLDDGQKVLLHCRGGLGRSGMVALRLLVERGEGSEAALARIRSVRPGAVETEAQQVWGGVAPLLPLREKVSSRQR
jgi:Cyclin-dependent kinase inhibitor 3 (CDKN3)